MVLCRQACVCARVCVCPCCVSLPAAAVAALESLSVSLYPFSSFSILHATPPVYLRMRGALFENKAEEKSGVERRGEKGQV